MHVRAVVDVDLVPGDLEIVSGIIPGSAFPGEEIVITAHPDHYKPGANDDRTQQNFIYTEDWRTILIDHSQAFRFSGEYKE
jgi:hypothetical protein